MSSIPGAAQETGSQNHRGMHTKSISADTVTTKKLQLRGLGQWTTYTPTLTGGTPGAGGVVTGRFRVIDQTLDLVIAVTTAAAGTSTGAYTLTVPTGCLLKLGTVQTGNGSLLCLGASGATNTYVLVPFNNTATVLECMCFDSAAATGVASVWGTASNAAAQLSAAVNLVAVLNMQLQLDPTSPILLSGGF